MRKKFVFTVLLGALLALSACGNRGYIDDGTTVHTLSVFAPRQFAEAVRQAAEDIVAAWETQHPYYIFDLQLTSVSDQNFNSAYVSMIAGIEAGGGYDLFFTFGAADSTLGRAGRLANIYSLMDQDPFTNPSAFSVTRDDFWQQPLRALEVDGALYKLPLSFGFQYISINDSLPWSIIDRFTRHETISLSDLLHIYHELTELYPEYSHWHFASGLTAGVLRYAILLDYMQHFIDYEAGTADLTNDEFIDFLAHRYGMLNRPMATIAWGLFREPFRSYDDTMRVATSHVFHMDSSHLSPALAFIDPSLYHPERLAFSNPRALTDRQGRLIMDHWSRIGHVSTWANVSINAVGNYELAWEFTQYLVGAFSQPRGLVPINMARNYGWGRYSFATPIMRDMYRPHITTALESVNRFMLGATPLLGTEINTGCADTLGAILARLETYNEMPMTIPVPLELLQRAWGELENFMSGDITPDEFANILQQEISIMLAESP